jgi:hypothetical protein
MARPVLGILLINVITHKAMNSFTSGLDIVRAYGGQCPDDASGILDLHHTIPEEAFILTCCSKFNVNRDSETMSKLRDLYYPDIVMTDSSSSLVSSSVSSVSPFVLSVSSSSKAKRNMNKHNVFCRLSGKTKLEECWFNVLGITSDHLAELREILKDVKWNPGKEELCYPDVGNSVDIRDGTKKKFKKLTGKLLVASTFEGIAKQINVALNRSPNVGGGSKSSTKLTGKKAFQSLPILDDGSGGYKIFIHKSDITKISENKYVSHGREYTSVMHASNHCRDTEWDSWDTDKQTTWMKWVDVNYHGLTHTCNLDKIQALERAEIKVNIRNTNRLKKEKKEVDLEQQEVKLEQQ